MAKIGFLGLGMMGSGMAGCLVRAGHEVTVWNRSAEAVDGADAVFTMIADDAASDACWFGAAGAMDRLAPGAFVIECSTVSHRQSGKLAEAATGRGLRYIDCPVNGPPVAAAKGELTLLVGAAPADLGGDLPH